MKFKLLLCFIFFNASSFAQITHFEKSNGTESAPYFEGIEWWENFYSENNVRVIDLMETDAGYKINLVGLSSESVEFTKVKESNKTVILINNAIHPGEPDGVDASMMLFRDLVSKPELNKLLDDCIVLCIPYYNIGGALNRSSTSRANQDGPVEYGFRGNAQNLDLNRDFIKCDSKNAKGFAKLLQAFNPDIYIETHVSNGADYQYTMTYLATQPDKLGFGMGKYLRDKMIPSLEKSMTAKNETMVPYVNIHGGPLKDEIHTFYDLPRYSTGLTTLHQMFGFITETHMLKPFDKRVEATYKFLLSAIEFGATNNKEIKAKRKEAKKQVAEAEYLPFDWQIDTTKFKTINFLGYEYRYKKSAVTGADRLFYDREKPISKKVKYYNQMNITKAAKKPKFYILKQGFWEVADRLRANGVELKRLATDTTISVRSYRVLDFETVKNPYEKHYLHSNVTYTLKEIDYPFYKGDYLIPMGTDKDRFVVEVLEPDAPDSYFNWNFFDAVLQQKEWYSAYVFEDKAEQLLNENSQLKIDFVLKKKHDKDFASNQQAQLYWIYKQSPNYEKEHMRLPIFRIED